MIGSVKSRPSRVRYNLDRSNKWIHWGYKRVNWV